ncbi:MAG TPA: sigma-70 family RNA polymerase sigma factor [Actinomycetota bacterium]|jgi:RNA polymerase sigma factor (sigma-70 family)|nr:sigma-70 family RNA polymerase sigma factor [Actinomycetota bacterium]
MLDPQTAVRLVRQEWSQVVAVAMRILGDLDEAEDMAQEALLEATRRWPVDGVPANPGAWLTTVARNRALNRRRDERRRGGPTLALDEGLVPVMTGDAADAADLDGFGDDRLRLVVLCCHPSLRRDAQVALTLRLVGGLTVREIANAFVQREATVAQRISRAKRSLHEHRVGFELPPVAELPARLGAVLEVVYLVFNEGYGPHSSDQRRRSLCQEALMLADQLTEIAPTVPEVWGLAALLQFQSSRFDARLAPDGTLIPLDEQDRRRWDRQRVRLGERCLAAGHNAAGPGRPIGPYLLQAEIAARHARAPTFADTDWHAIEQLYAALVEITGNPIVRLNWAIARSFTHGPQEALGIIDQLGDVLGDYHLLAATRADLLRRAGRTEEAAELFQALVASASTEPQRRLYRRRLAECADS